MKIVDRKKIFIVSALILLALALIPVVLSWTGRVKKYAPAAETDSMPKTIINEKDGSELILIPAGEFTMGSPDGTGENDEHPQHKVYLDAYYIGKYEVTNEQFARFVNETGYQPEGAWKLSYNSSTTDHPVGPVSWADAVAYCNWAALRLPTEAEWEKAARGQDGRTYPWGNKWDASRCNNSVIRASSGKKPVGSFPSGASPYGCLDMAGNVWEWCHDWYSDTYYSSSPSKNPRGPGSEELRILRGGSWYLDKPSYYRTANRYRHVPEDGNINNGIRPVRSR
ncbi:MAG: formylglycine-generating enzyme family protein [bacterium]